MKKSDCLPHEVLLCLLKFKYRHSRFMLAHPTVHRNNIFTTSDVCLGDVYKLEFRNAQRCELPASICTLLVK